MKAGDTYDVIVIGGGPAGTVAATQAGRAGARTPLVEKTGRLGGTTINAAINRPGLFHAWGRQIIAGIGWYLVERTVRESGNTLPDFADTSGRHFHHQPTVDMMIYAALCDEAVTGSGAELLFHAMPGAVEQAGDGWQVTLCAKEGLLSVRTKVLIDCTGDANVVAMAGLPLRIPDETQPATLSCRLSGYDLDTLDAEALTAAFRKAIDEGEVKASDGCWHVDKPSPMHFLRGLGRNGNHLTVGSEARTSAGKTALEIEGRRSIYRMVTFLRRQPGLEHLQVDWVAPESGVRETATIEGEVTVTLEDYVTGKVWEDAVCYAYYPVDLHGMDTDKWKAWALEKGTVGTIPRRALVPRGARNLLVAGRCLSSDRLANSALRVQAPCMAMGQAAGALAALASAGSQTVLDVPLEDLRALLEKHGAIVP